MPTDGAPPSRALGSEPPTSIFTTSIRSMLRDEQKLSSVVVGTSIPPPADTARPGAEIRGRNVERVHTHTVGNGRRRQRTLARAQLPVALPCGNRRWVRLERDDPGVGSPMRDLERDQAYIGTDIKEQAPGRQSVSYFSDQTFALTTR
jgi:hypothetical protein